MNLSEIWRYPVKSLTGSSLDRVVLNPDLGLPHDRRWALARPNGKAATDTEWHPKSQFYVMVRDYGLTELKCEFDDLSGLFSLERPNGLKASGNLASPEGRAEIEDAVAAHLGLSEDERPILKEAQKIGYFDTTEGPVSLLNMASLRALEDVIGQSIDPIRFRMNFQIEGAEPWCEKKWLGKRVRIGKTVVLHITENTGRCKATHINPATGELDMKILHALKHNFDHTNMGVYAKVIEGGLIRPGDEIEVLD